MPNYADFMNIPVGSELETELGRPSTTGLVTTPSGNVNVFGQGGDNYNQYFPSGDFRFAQTPGPITSPQENIDDLPKIQFKAAQIEAEKEYDENCKRANLYAGINPQQHQVLLGEADIIRQLAMKEARTKLQKTELIFQKYQQDPTLDSKDSYFAKSKYLDSNPIYKAPQRQAQQMFTPAHIQKVTQELQSGGMISEGMIKEFLDKDTMIAYAHQNLPQEMWSQAEQLAKEKFAQVPQVEVKPEHRGALRVIKDWLNSTPEPNAPATTTPTNVIYARNPKTGQRIMSIDGGRTWQTATQ